MVKIGNPLSSVYKSPLPLIHTLRAPPLAPLFLLAEAIKLIHNRERRNAIATRKKTKPIPLSKWGKDALEKINKEFPPSTKVGRSPSVVFIRARSQRRSRKPSRYLEEISSTNATTKIQPIISIERFDMI